VFGICQVTFNDISRVAIGWDGHEVDLIDFTFGQELKLTCVKLITHGVTVYVIGVQIPNVACRFSGGRSPPRVNY